MSLDVISEHMSKIMRTKVSSIMSKAIDASPSTKVSDIIAELTNSDTFDAFYRTKNATFNVNMRDLLQSKDIERMSVEPLWHAIPSLSENDTVEKAVRIITNNRTRSAPVIQDGRIAGAVESRNILKLVSELDNRWITANQIFTPNPVTVDKQTSMSVARKLMITKRIDHLPVINGDKVSQVLTSYHLLQSLLPSERVGKKDVGSKKIRNLESQIGNLGTSRMTTCSPLDDLNHVLGAMLHANTTFCLVTLRTGLQGIITYRDILNLLVTRKKSTVPLFIVGMPNDDNAEIVTNKFTKVLDKLARVYPDIQEARVYVKQTRTSGNRANHEVSAMILTPISRRNFSTSSYDLSKAFDEISGRIMRTLSKRAKRRNKLSIRKMA